MWQAWGKNGACAHYVMVSKFQWKPFWLATQRDPQNDWTATQDRVSHDVFAQAPFFPDVTQEKSPTVLIGLENATHGSSFVVSLIASTMANDLVSFVFVYLEKKRFSNLQPRLIHKCLHCRCWKSKQEHSRRGESWPKVITKRGNSSFPYRAQEMQNCDRSTADKDDCWVSPIPGLDWLEVLERTRLCSLVLVEGTYAENEESGVGVNV